MKAVVCVRALARSHNNSQAKQGIIKEL